MKAIILSHSNYKEKDCIYNALTEEGYVSFQAKGAQDPKSKHVWLNNPLTVADVDFSEDGRYKHKLLKSAMPLMSALIGGSGLEYNYSIYVLAELSQCVLPDEEKHLAFNDLFEAIKALKSGKDVYMVVLVYMAKLSKLSGVEAEVDKCVICGKKEHIAAFSFEDGGFVCSKCLKEGIKRDLTVKQMKIIRYIFKSPDYSMKATNDFADADKKVILLKLKEFADSSIGVSLKAIETLAK